MSERSRTNFVLTGQFDGAQVQSLGQAVGRGTAFAAVAAVFVAAFGTSRLCILLPADGHLTVQVHVVVAFNEAEGDQRKSLHRAGLVREFKGVVP